MYMYIVICKNIFIYDFLLDIYLHFKCYPESPLYPPPDPSPTHPFLLFWHWCFPVLGHIKFARPRGLSSQWWPTSATYAARDTSSGGYWSVHIVVPPIGLQTPSAPWVLSLAPTLGALCSILYVQETLPDSRTKEMDFWRHIMLLICK
jgi:hypothetical protein